MFSVLKELILYPIIAAWLLPSPGRKLQIGEAIKEPIKGLSILVFGLVIICFGILTLVFILISNVDPPNSPPNKGRSGWFREGKFSTISPSVPVRIKTKNALNFFLSKRIKKMDVTIRM